MEIIPALQRSIPDVVRDLSDSLWSHSWEKHDLGVLRGEKFTRTYHRMLVRHTPQDSDRIDRFIFITWMLRLEINMASSVE